jgi:hypothetical protein
MRGARILQVRARHLYSTPEGTALELVGYPNRAGGLDNVATVLSELSEEMVAERLYVLALPRLAGIRGIGDA